MADKEYGKCDFDGTFSRAFKNNLEGTILLDGHTLRNTYLVDCFEYGQDEGLIEHKSTLEESQWTTIFYGLTDKGKEYYQSHE